MRTHSMTMNRLSQFDDHESEIEVEFTMTPRVAATYWDPAEGGEIDICKIYAANGKEITVSDDELTKIEDYIAENVEDDIFDEDPDMDYRERRDCRG